MGARSVAVTGAVAGAAVLVALAGCSSGSKPSGSSGSTATTESPKALDVLVSNDDGYSADGIDVVVEALRKLPNVKISVVAPAENKSGTGSSVTRGEVTATRQKTKSGYPATAVNGFPADSVNYALAHVLTRKPDVVVTGINFGQNLGPITGVSGTVGAAKAAAAAGIPALAASQGLAAKPDYPSAAKLVVDWVTARRDLLVAGTATTDVVNLNVPTCTVGKLRGLKQEPLSTNANGVGGIPNCTSTATTFSDDVSAFLAGFATVTQLTATGEVATTPTTWPTAG